MSEQYFTDIHRDSFKLRILMTDACNRRCPYCLNDFQDKGFNLIDASYAVNLASEYVSFCQKQDIVSEIYLSGSEPCIHPDFEKIVKSISILLPDKFVLCTNGDFLARWGNTFPLFDELHISIHENGNCIEDRFLELVPLLGIYDDEIVFNVMFSRENAVYIRNIFKSGVFCENIKLKVWGDYFRRYEQPYWNEYLGFIDANPGILHRGRNFRQTNRGFLCSGCGNDCVSLKALWVFPNHGCSPCPQGRHLVWQGNDFKKYVRQAHTGHKATRRKHGSYAKIQLHMFFGRIREAQANG